jgi:hypothetical protein
LAERKTTHAPGPLNDTRCMRIFVYGSSMNSSAICKCCPGGAFFAIAYLPDYELCFPRWDQGKRTFIVGYQPAANSRLWGVIWLIPESERNSLDNAKGCRPGQPGHRYDRVPITVRLADGSAAEVETYRAVGAAKGQPSKAHLELIVAGAQEHDLPRNYIDQLRRTATSETVPSDCRAIDRM